MAEKIILMFENLSLTERYGGLRLGKNYQKWEKFILKRDKYKCVKCGNKHKIEKENVV